MSAHTLIETARDAPFLARLPAEPVALGLLGDRGRGPDGARRKRKRRGASLPLTLALPAAVTARCFDRGSASVADPSLRPLLKTSGFASWALSDFGFELGGLFTVIQAKRLFGVQIGAGSVLGAVVGAGIG